jgi:hypothetical protein
MPTKQQLADQQAAIEQLREWLPPGSTVQTILRHVSRSGMVRDISAIATVDGEPFDITYWVSRALIARIADGGGIRRGGCGMDMGFDLVYSLSRTLYRDGFYCIGESTDRDRTCPSNDHFNDRGVRNYSHFRHHSDGGYALRQRWL